MTRFKQIDCNTWESVQDPSITVHVNREYDEELGTWFYCVYPAKNHSGIPNTPSIFNEEDWDSEEEAYKYAVKEAKKIMKLSLREIRKFEWRMID